VDDDTDIRRLICETLNSNGYIALEATHCAHAIRIFEEQQKLIALLITDIVMPRFSGRDLAKMLVRQNPELKVLFVSGYAYCKTDDDPPHSRFLEKPFNQQSLLKSVTQLLA
jgi:two-component system cell cycle sensor histidine kinase/response regulator CckA